MGGKASAPEAPNYGYLAQQQTQDSEQLAQQQAEANHPNTTTPFGTSSWTFDPKTQQWTGSQTLNPTLQSTLNTEEQTGLAGAQQAGAAQGQAQNLFNSDVSSGAFGPLDYSGVQKVNSGNYYTPQAQDAVWNEFQTMQQPLQAQQMEQQQSQLEAQGLRPGDAAYDNAIHNLQNTQYQQQQAAQDQAVLAGEQEAQTMQGMDLQAQQAQTGLINQNAFNNLNLYNSLMAPPGSVSTNTSMPYTPTSLPQTPNLLGAGEAQYNAGLDAANAQNASSGSLWGGIGSIASIAAVAL